jgi:hypothetical protein
MKLLSVSDYFYILLMKFTEIFIHSFTINLMKMYSNFERTQPIFEKIPKVIADFPLI